MCYHMSPDLVVTSSVVFAVVAIVALILVTTVERMTTAIQEFARVAMDNAKAFKKEKKRSDNLIGQMLPPEVSWTSEPIISGHMITVSGNETRRYICNVFLSTTVT